MQLHLRCIMQLCVNTLGRAKQTKRWSPCMHARPVGPHACMPGLLVPMHACPACWSPCMHARPGGPYACMPGLVVPMHACPAWWSPCMHARPGGRPGSPRCSSCHDGCEGCGGRWAFNLGGSAAATETETGIGNRNRIAATIVEMGRNGTGASS